MMSKCPRGGYIPATRDHKKQEQPMARASDVAKYLLAQMSDECGDTISALKLQKLLYYAQGCHLATYDTPLFPEAIKAWEHGPVVPAVWHAYKQYESSAIPRPTTFDISTLKASQRELLKEVYRIFGQFSAWKLRNMTHVEPPWRDTARNATISQKTMRDYFKTRVKIK